MRRWFRWGTRISLGLVALLIIFVAVLFIQDPSRTTLVAAMLFDSLTGNEHPPPIVEDQLAGASWQNEAEASAKLTALLQRKFPTGTNEDTLRATLSGQGFKPLPQSKILEYRWGDGVCAQTITVRWWTSNRHEIRQLDAGYSEACL